MTAEPRNGDPQAGFDPEAVRERRICSTLRRSGALRTAYRRVRRLPASGCQRPWSAGSAAASDSQCALPGRVRSLGAVSRAFRRCGQQPPWRCCIIWRVWLQQEAAGADSSSPPANSSPTRRCSPSKIARRNALRHRRAQPLGSHHGRCHRRGAGRRRRASPAYQVRFDLGATSDSPPAVMDASACQLDGALEQPFEMASGAGHDAAVFAVGIPTGMIFVAMSMAATIPPKRWSSMTSPSPPRRSSACYSISRSESAARQPAWPC